MREVQLLGTLNQEPPVDEVLAGYLEEELQESLHSIAGEIPVSLDPKPPEQAARVAASCYPGRAPRALDRTVSGASWALMIPIAPSARACGFLALAGACLLLALSLAAWLRAGRYETLAQSCQQEQEDVFRRVLPGARVPIGIRSRLETEYRTLAGVTGQMEGVPRLESASALLWEATGRVAGGSPFSRLGSRCGAEPLLSGCRGPPTRGRRSLGRIPAQARPGGSRAPHGAIGRQGRKPRPLGPAVPLPMTPPRKSREPRHEKFPAATPGRGPSMSAFWSC